MLKEKVITNDVMRYKNRMRKQVLLADDDEISKKLVSIILSKNGFDVIAVTNGKEVVSAFEKDRFDIILMDIEMPYMNGYSATSQIRLKEKTMNFRTPIIAITACGLKGDREKCLEAGMDDYISKPININQLVGIIQKHLTMSIEL